VRRDGCERLAVRRSNLAPMSVVHSRSGQMAGGLPAGNCEQREISSEALCT
jgi:hypothetical protein